MAAMYRILFVLCILYSSAQLNASEGRFSQFRSAFRISPGRASARNNNDDDFNESHATLLPSTRSKPLGQTTPFNMATTKKKIISTLLEMTENEISKKLSQFDSNVENNEVLSSNNKRFKNEPSTTLAAERSDSSTSSLFELTTEASVKQTTTTSASTTAKPRKTIKITTESQDSIAAAEAAAAAIANMHSMHFSSVNKNINRVSAPVTPTKVQVHHHNPYGDYNNDKINFDVNYRPTEAPPEKQASSAPAKKSKDKNRESVKNLLNGLVNFVSSPLFNQAKPLIVSSFSTVSNVLSANKNAIGSLSSSSSNSMSSSSSSASSSASTVGGLNASLLTKMFNSLRSFAMLRRNEANAGKNNKKKGKLNSAVNSNSQSNNALANQSMLMQFLDSLIKTREALLSSMTTPNKSRPGNKLSTSSSSSSSNNKVSNLKPSSATSPYASYLNLFRLLWKSPTLKQEARSI